MLDFRGVVAVASLEFMIPSASLCKRSTIPFIISAPDIHGPKVLVIETSRANEFLNKLILRPRSTGTHEQVAVQLGRLHRLLQNGGSLLAA